MKIVNFIASLFSRFLFGHDIFISYSRGDCGNYAERLAIELQQAKFRCYIDRWETKPGVTLPKELVRKLKHSSMLVVLGTKAAINSEAIKKEIEEFSKTGRVIIPVDFGYLKDARWYESLIGLPVIYERETHLQSDKPSDAIKESIDRSFSYQRLNARQRRVTLITAGILFLLVTGIVLASMTLNKLRTTSGELSNSNSRLLKTNDTLNQNNLNIYKQNVDLQLNIDSVKKSLQIQMAVGQGLRILNDHVTDQLKIGQNELKQTASNLSKSTLQIEINRNLANSISSDFQNLPLESYNFALTAFQTEITHRISPTLSSLLMSKAVNRGIARVIKMPETIDELTVMDSAIFIINYRKAILRKLNSNYKTEITFPGKFKGLGINNKTHHLFTCEFDDSFENVDVLELDRNCRPINRRRILSKSTWDGNVPWINIMRCNFDFSFSDLTPDLCLKFIFAGTNQLIYRVNYDLSKMEQRKMSFIIPAPKGWNMNLNRPFYFANSSISLYSFNDNIFTDNLISGKHRIINSYYPGTVQIRGNDEEHGGTDRGLFCYDNNGLLAYADDGWTEFLTIVKDSIRFNKLFKLPNQSLITNMQFLENKKLLFVLKDRDNDKYTMDVLQIDTAERVYNVGYFNQWAATVEHDNFKNEYYQMDHLGRFKLNGTSGVKNVLYDDNNVSVMLVENDGNVEVVNLGNNHTYMLYGLKMKPRFSTYDKLSEQLYVVKDSSTIEVWAMNNLLPYDIEDYGAVTAPGEIRSLFNTNNQYQVLNAYTVGTLRQSDDEELVRSVTKNITGQTAVYDYHNRKFNFIASCNGSDLVKIIPGIGAISFQEDQFDTYTLFNFNNPGKVIPSVKQKKTRCRFLDIKNGDSTWAYCNSQICQQSFSNAGECVILMQNQSVKKSMKELTNGCTIGDGIISPNGDYYCDYVNGKLRTWSYFQDNLISSIPMDSLAYMQFIPRTNNLLCVTAPNKYRTCSFKTIDIRHSKIVNVFRCRVWEQLSMEISDSSLYFKNAGETMVTEMSLYNLYTSKSRRIWDSHQQPDRLPVLFSMSHDQKWVASYERLSNSNNDHFVKISSYTQPSNSIEYSFPAIIKEMFFSADDLYLYVQSGSVTYRLAAPAK